MSIFMKHPSTGERIKMFRTRAGMTKTEVSYRLGIPLEEYEDYEDGRLEVPKWVISRCSTLFKAPELKLLLKSKERL